MGPIANRKFTVSAPGRVCLFGEHQDYLGMPSIVMAINLRCRIEIEERDDRLVCWSSPKLGPEYSGQIDLDDLHNLEPTLESPLSKAPTLRLTCLSCLLTNFRL